MKTRSGKLKQIIAIVGISTTSIGAIGSISPVKALTFNFIPEAGTSQQAIDGFTAAGNLWSNYLDHSNVTINIKIGFKDLGNSNTLAVADSYAYQLSYSQVYNALNTKKTSADDIAGVSNLSTNGSFNRLINYTSENNSATPYLNSANTLFVNTANAKALGLSNDTAQLDAAISFNSGGGYTWDFTTGTTVATGQYHFIGIAAHEIGHALGFVSGVDDFDNPGGTNSQSDPYTTSVLDLFRYSSRSNTNGNVKVIDMAADSVAKYFSLDGGITPIATFAQGSVHGVGTDYKWQASHWADNQNLGMMDPTSSPGQYLAITENDLRAVDVIGYKRKNTAVPEPSTWIGTIIFGAFGIKTILKRRQKITDVIDREPNGDR